MITWPTAVWALLSHAGQKISGLQHRLINMWVMFFVLGCVFCPLCWPVAVKSAVCAGSSHLPTAKPALQADRKATCCTQTSTRGQSATICAWKKLMELQSWGVNIICSTPAHQLNSALIQAQSTDARVFFKSGVFWHSWSIIIRLKTPVRKINSVALFCCINIRSCLSKYKPYNIFWIFSPLRKFSKSSVFSDCNTVHMYKRPKCTCSTCVRVDMASDASGVSPV